MRVAQRNECFVTVSGVCERFGTRCPRKSEKTILETGTTLPLVGRVVRLGDGDIYLHRNHTLAKRCETNNKYAYVVSRYDGMTTMATLSGVFDGTMDVPLMVFKNPSRFYPIRGLPDVVPGVAYLFSTNSFRDLTLFFKWVNERKIFQALPKYTHIYYTWIIMVPTNS